ncbi:MAG: zinc dependent phospholipase C family protein, partial [Myxococcota bacterium]
MRTRNALARTLHSQPLLRRGLLASCLALSASLQWPALACGISTHVEVSNRAQWWFDAQAHPEYAQYVAENPEALQGGSSFPDWGYILPNYGDAAEEAHWDPFLMHAADYVYRTYPPPWDKETERLSVFLFAVSAHSVADISWHGLGVQEGFIDVLSAQDFHDDWGAAHTAADTGGDMVAAYELDQSYLLNKWYVPLDDMLNIYHEMGYDTVNRQVMLMTNLLIFVGAHAERIAGQLLYPMFAKNTPLLTDLYQDYFAGGVDDMSGFTAWKWLEMIEWMENGVSGSRFEVQPDHEHLTLHHPWINLGLELIDRGELTVSMSRTERGVMFEAHYPKLAQDKQALRTRLQQKQDTTPNTYARVREKLWQVAEGTLSLPLPAEKLPSHAVPTLKTSAGRTQAASLTYTSTTPFAHLGSGLSRGDFNRDGRQDLVVSAPGWGGPGTAQTGFVAVSYGRSTLASGSLTLPNSADLWRRGAQEYARFGWQVAVLDFNADGFDDLAISSPTTEAASLSYFGQVDVFFGSSTGLSTSPDVSIQSTQVYHNFGHVMRAGDVNGDGIQDLVVASPYAREGGTQRGRVDVFVSRAGISRGTVLSPDDAELSLVGANSYDWFGHSVAVSRLKSGEILLLVGAPGYNGEGLQSSGRLYGYSLTGVASGTASTAPRFTLTGSGEQGQLGLSMAVGDPYGTGYPVVALASPTFGELNQTQAGAVSLYRLHELSGELLDTDVVPVVTLLGSEDY